MKRLAIFFPGIGYTLDKPLLYYSRRIAAACGFETRGLPYTGFPGKILGDRSRMEESFRIAMDQTRALLADVEWDTYEEILFTGKSIGTIAAACLASESPVRDRIRLILYTPLEDTFSFPFEDAIVFTGSRDPWVGEEKSRISGLCRERGCPCTLIPGANHSLETKDAERDLENLQRIMALTRAFICHEQAPCTAQ